MQALLILVAGVAFGLRMPIAAGALCLVLVALLGVGLASLSYALGLILQNEYQFAPVLQMATLPLMLLSGILLPMSLAPAWLDAVSYLSPFRYVYANSKVSHSETLCTSVNTELISSGDSPERTRR